MVTAYHVGQTPGGWQVYRRPNFDKLSYKYILSKVSKLDKSITKGYELRKPVIVTWTRSHQEAAPSLLSMGNLVSHLLPFLRTPHDVTRKTKKSYLWPSRENLVSHLRPLWRTLNEIILRIKKAIVSPPQFDKNEIIRHAPVIVDWLQGASENSGTSGDSTVSLLGFLQFAFQSGNIGKIYRLAATPDEALDIMLAVSSLRTFGSLVLSSFLRLAIYPPEWRTPTINWRGKSLSEYFASLSTDHPVSLGVFYSMSNSLRTPLILPMITQRSILEITMGKL